MHFLITDFYWSVVTGLTSHIFVKWELEYVYFCRYIQNGNVYPCVHLGIYRNSTNQMLMDHYCFTEQIRLTELCQYRCICTSIEKIKMMLPNMLLFQSKHLPHLRCCTILGMEKSLKIYFMFTFLVH